MNFLGFTVVLKLVAEFCFN